MAQTFKNQRDTSFGPPNKMDKKAAYNYE